MAVLGVVVLAIALIALHDPRVKGVQAYGAETALPSTRAAAQATTTTPGGPTPASSATSSAAAGSSLVTPTSLMTPTLTPRPVALSVLKAVPIVVLNNTATTGLATRAKARLETGGWTVTQAANYQADIASTCAYYDQTVANAKYAALALQRQFPTIKRVQTQFSAIASYHSPVVLILTPDYVPE